MLMLGVDGVVVPLRGGNVNVEPLRLLLSLSFALSCSSSTFANIFDFRETELTVSGFVFVGAKTGSTIPVSES